MTRLRPVRADDLAAVLALNEAQVPHLGRVDLDAMARFAATADHFKVAETDGDISGFLIALTPGADYASPNFQWFRDRYAQFVYCDRIMVAPAAQGRGLGRALYADLARFAAGRAPRITCEVNVRPPNPESLAFHARLGFTEVGRQETEGGAKEVALLSWEFGR